MLALPVSRPRIQTQLPKASALGVSSSADCFLDSLPGLKGQEAIRKEKAAVCDCIVASERSVRGRLCGKRCPAGTCGKEAKYRFCEHTWEKLSVAIRVRTTAVFSILVVTRETENLGWRDGSEA